MHAHTNSLNRPTTIIACLMVLVTATRADNFTVTTTADDGPGSLREMLINGNTNLGPDRIEFAIPIADPGYDPALGVWTIRPLSALPALTDDGTTIDGTTQATFIGGDANPLGPEIELDGSLAGDEEVSGLTILSAQNEIRCLVVNNFAWFGINLDGWDADNNIVAGNYVGTDATGLVDRGNGFSGIFLYSGASGNTIGGPEEDDRNLVSGNGWSGVELQGDGVVHNQVVGNYIGIDRTGIQPLGNTHEGVDIWSSAAHNTIGGATASLRNIIAGNERNGLSVAPAHSSNNLIIGNHIGLDVTGTLAVPNGGGGIVCSGDSTIIGGIAAGEGNLIGGNDNNGITLGAGTDSRIVGNYIGTNTSGADLRNYYQGISIQSAPVNLIVGPGNTIAYHIDDGIEVFGPEAVGVTITQNSIYANGVLGIDNADGGNTELDPPTITTADATSITGTTLAGGIVEIFSDNDDQGRIYEATVTTDGDGHFTWSGAVTGPNVTATVTDTGGSTSEFSSAITIVAVDDHPAATDRLVLRPNYPNPFNPITRIEYSSPEDGHLLLRVLDLRGRLVRTLIDQPRAAGDGAVIWDGLDESGTAVASGSYLAEIKIGRDVDVARMTLVR